MTNDKSNFRLSFLISFQALNDRVPWWNTSPRQGHTLEHLVGAALRGRPSFYIAHSS